MSVSVTVKVDPVVISWILNRIKNENVNSAILEELRSWRDLKVIPKYTDIERISKKIHMPNGIFFLHEPPKINKEIAEFRTINNEKNEFYSLNLEDTISIMKSIQDWMNDYLKEEGHSKLDFIGILNITDNYKDAAQRVREVLDIKIDWNTNVKNPDNLFKKIQNIFQNIGILFMKNKFVGVDIHHGRKLDVEEFRAFALNDSLAPLIFINRNDSITGQIFSSFHELIHLFLGKSSLLDNTDLNSNLYNSVETFCNKVTSEILVPEEILKNKWNNQADLIEEVNNLSTYFNVSRKVIIFRASNLNLINDYEKTFLLKIFKSGDKSNEENLEQDEKSNIIIQPYNKRKARIDNHFLKALKKSVNEGNTSYTEAFHLTKTDLNQYMTLMENISD